MALKDYEADMMRCSQCTYCEWIPFDQVKSQRFAKGCPSIAYHYFLSYAARGRFAIGLSLLRGKGGYSDKVTDIVYKCQTCGACDVSCKVCRYNLEPLQTWLETRAKLVEDGKILPAHKKMLDNLRSELNTMDKPRLERSWWADGLDVKRLHERKAEVVFFAGCRYSYDTELQSIARTAVTVLKQAGVDIAVMGDEEVCCGGRIYQMGFRDDFRACAEKLIEAWWRAGVRTVVTSCADCYHAIKRLYPAEVGAEFEILHTVEYIDRLIKDGKIHFTKPVSMTVTYHDPCHLGRQGEPYVRWSGQEKKVFGQIVTYDPPKPRYNGAKGIYDAPRNILTSIPGLELVEMERIREYAWCCGAGGGVREAYPDFSTWTATERIEEASATGAKAIVSACPWCEREFIDAINFNNERMHVYDIIELVRQAME